MRLDAEHKVGQIDLLGTDGGHAGREIGPSTVPPFFPQRQTNLLGSVVIVGGGAAGNVAAEMLRREGYAGHITLLSVDASVSCDRPNLSHGYLAGTAPAASNPLRSPDF